MKALLALFLLLGALPTARAATQEQAAGIRYEQHPGAALPAEAAFTDETGQRVRLGGYFGARPLIVAFVYFHCPNLCGVVMADTLAALKAARLGAEDYTLLAVSIDPAEGPAEAAASKAAHLRAEPLPGKGANWHFLTGTAENISALEQAAGFEVRVDAVDRQFIHPAGIVVATPAGVVSRYLLGVGYSAGDVKLALAEAGGGGVAAPALPVLLTCWHYDAATGRYTLDVLNLLRLAGVLTVLTVGGTLFLAFRRGGRQS